METGFKRKLTDNHKKKISIAHKGKTPWNKGIKGEAFWSLKNLQPLSAIENLKKGNKHFL